MGRQLPSARLKSYRYGHGVQIFHRFVREKVLAIFQDWKDKTRNARAERHLDHCCLNALHSAASLLKVFRSITFTRSNIHFKTSNHILGALDARQDKLFGDMYLSDVLVLRPDHASSLLFRLCFRNPDYLSISTSLPRLQICQQYHFAFIAMLRHDKVGLAQR